MPKDTHLGWQWCLNGIDHFSKKAWSIPVKAQTAARAIEMVDLIRLELPELQQMWVDNGSAFIAKVFIDHCTSLGIKVVHSIAYQPTGHGGIERFHFTVKLMVHSATLMTPNGYRGYLKPGGVLELVMLQYNNR